MLMERPRGHTHGDRQGLRVPATGAMHATEPSWMRRPVVSPGNYGSGSCLVHQQTHLLPATQRIMRDRSKAHCFKMLSLGVGYFM